MVGGYLSDKPRDPLYALARSADWWERRTAIVATYFFIRQDDLDDTFAIADILADDPEDLVQKAVGGWVREAGKRDRGRLIEFLDRHAAPCRARRCGTRSSTWTPRPAATTSNSAMRLVTAERTSRGTPL